jgi:hypothetical protein
MIKEDYVNFETAKLLYKKGFDCECIGYYVYYEPNNVKFSFVRKTNSTWGSRCYSAPTFQMAMKWLREVHCIDIDITSYWKMSPEYANNGYRFKTHSIGDPNGETSGSFDTYEQAAESAIKYCLTNLI